MVSTSAYDFHPNPWRLFTTNGGPVLSGADLGQLGPGAALWLYTGGQLLRLGELGRASGESSEEGPVGGQFLWPGVRIGHKFRVPIPRVAEDGEHSETRMVARIGPSVKFPRSFLVGEHSETKMVEMTTASLRPPPLDPPWPLA